MTYKEKWIQEHPNEVFRSSDHCPRGSDGKLISCPDGKSCEGCWDQEIPEDVHMQCGNLKITRHADGSSTMVMVGKDIPDEPIPVGNDLNSIDKPGAYTIKDSGDRTEFPTGAVRDMREGKGRCDLMPLEVVASWLKSKVLDCIAQFKIHGDTIHLYGAMNYFLDDAGWSYYEACLEVAKHFEEGAKKYGENNWQKGIPVHCYIDSAIRHYFKFMCGMKDEPHDRAFVWNLMCCIWEVDYHKGDAHEEN